MHPNTKKAIEELVRKNIEKVKRLCDSHPLKKKLKRKLKK